ncbi:MAG: hypothetical protein LBH25_03255 [Fibromonadaceae bacterium]|jgi:hypothetical protein|nr:hypothetical protein [Fibromonadaceae bacterium]
MRFIIPILFLCLLASCGGSKPGVDSKTNLYQALDGVLCPGDDFRGSGVGNSESEALAQARSNMALEHFSKKLKSNIQISGQNIDGIASTSTKADIKQETTLLNAQDAKLHFSTRQGNETGVVACMSKADAAKSYVQRQSLLLDSLELLMAGGLKTTHPKQKNGARNKANVIWMRMLANNDLLKSWGMENDVSRAKDIHEAIENDYKEYCKNMKVHWEDSKNECSDASFAMLSKKVKIEKSLCTDGLKLRFACAEKCKSFSLGVECSAEPSLAIESCEGESYSLLRAKEPITGSDMNNANRAMENLIENFNKANFFNEWEKEIKEWVPQCVD